MLILSDQQNIRQAGLYYNVQLVRWFLALILSFKQEIVQCGQFVPKLLKHLNGQICRETYLPIYKDKEELYLRCSWHSFHLEVYRRTKKELFNEINRKHLSIKFDKKSSKSEIELLFVLVYKRNNKGTSNSVENRQRENRQRENIFPYLHARSDHPVSLKKSIPNSQILHVK